MSVTVLRSLSDLPVATWRSLVDAAPVAGPFMAPSFLLPWTEAFAPDTPKAILLLDDPDGVVGMLPLHRPYGKGGWESLGGEAVADVLDAVVVLGREALFWSSVAPVLADLLDDGPIRLFCIPESSSTLRCLVDVAGTRGWTVVAEEAERSPFLRLPSSFDGYLDGLGKKDRHELKRKIRRAEESVPGVRYRVTESAKALSDDMGSFIDLHRKSAPEKAGFMDGAMERFFREVADRTFAEGRLRLCFLSDDRGNDLAAAFHFREKEALRLWNSGYDPAFRSAQPGVVLCARSIDDAIGLGCVEYDFLRGTERYKYDLGAVDRAILRITVTRP